MTQPLITAHSGCEGTLIDTMDSIEKALEFSADAIEIDIRLDPFGDLRISHDPLSIEDYIKKDPLHDVFRRIQNTSLLINFDVKEPEALFKTLDAAAEFGFSSERLIFTGKVDPDLMLNDRSLAGRANFFLNIEEVLKYVYCHRKEELTKELFTMLMEDPMIILIDESASNSEVYLSESIRIRQKMYAVTKTLREKVIEDTVRVYQDTGAMASNLPKTLLRTGIIDAFRSGSIPLSVWTVNEEDLIKRCLEIGVHNITTRRVQLTKAICSRNSLQSE